MLSEITKILKQKYSPAEAQTLAGILISESAEMTIIQSMLSNRTLKDYPLIISQIKRLLNDEPIQYILGKTDFCNLTIHCDSRALIPRPETEELVRWVLEETPADSSPRILDIGTGTGCIAIALAANLPKAEITAVDISEDALSLARENIENLDINNVTLRSLDILNASEFEGQFDIIVSNPPYISEKEKKEMENNVLDYEPHSALFPTGDDPLIFYKYISSFAMQHLTGALFLEMNQYFHSEIGAIVAGSGLSDVEIRNDMFSKPRMLRAKKLKP